MLWLTSRIVGCALKMGQNLARARTEAHDQLGKSACWLRAVCGGLICHSSSLATDSAHKPAKYRSVGLAVA